ncbi:hypothetical protein DYBT9275_03383 [Dyadobacter sp. CECT 9275]|uniref:Uncharacterized protein n=1 Tax=Dyadobacter helix TaxID=2822344 RepID=A0A916N5C4_9BACT|nr:hypothetical protein [Dyadobacter sp. CECT 9275]CAG5004501.1 hypothetical protein DYBT9275_03383 [Dyadobacter sp. CECT 9275]
MKKVEISLMVIGIVLLFFSCKTNAILTSNFESEVIGSLPAKDIPGTPDGDMISYFPELEPRLRIVAPASGSKALQFNMSPASGLTAHNQWLSFRGISTNFAETLWFTYTAVHSGMGGELAIDYADGSAGTIARMYIGDNGDVRLVRDFATSESELIGNVPPGVSHTVILTLNMNSGTFNLSILKEGGNITVKDHRVILENILHYANPAKPSVNFRFDDGESMERKYVLESVIISRKEP